MTTARAQARRAPAAVPAPAPAPPRRLAVGLGSCLGACLDPDYHCTTDRDCDVGEAGRCEVDRRCTAYDPSCPTLHRRYSDHSGPASNTCFDDAVTPVNLCAAGQPPARPAGCAAAVCKALPGCCDTGWSEACVQDAQLLCSDLVCDTRIAITASDKAGNTELWNLTWNGASWMMQPDSRKSVLAWLAPAPGETAPRLAGFSASAFVFDGGSVPIAAGRSYLEVDLGRLRSRRPSDRGARLHRRQRQSRTSRSPSSTTARRDDRHVRAQLSWGDLDHDAFPDGMATATNPASATYRLLSNTEAPDQKRQIGAVVDSSMAGGTTTGSPAVRGFDLDRRQPRSHARRVAFGSELNVHLGQRARPVRHAAAPGRLQPARAVADLQRHRRHPARAVVRRRRRARGRRHRAGDRRRSPPTR